MRYLLLALMTIPSFTASDERCRDRAKLHTREGGLRHAAGIMTRVMIGIRRYGKVGKHRLVLLLKFSMLASRSRSRRPRLSYGSAS